MKIKNTSTASTFASERAKFMLEATQYMEGIPPLPIIVAHLLQLRDNDDLAVISLAHAVESDPALTSKILRSANSAFYGLIQRVYTVREAIQVIGFEAVRSLAITSTVVGGLWVDDDLFDTKRFWKHSLRTGMFARKTALLIRYPKPDVLFTLGVLHDVGRASIIQAEPDGFREALNRMKAKSIQLWRAEREVLGVDHANVGGMLATRWQLPSDYAEAIQGHHDPASLATESLLSGIVALADSMAHAAAPREKGEYITPPLVRELWAPLGLDDNDARKIFCEKDLIEEHTRDLYETALFN
jgi:HD-like signal output (HDOD) protein